MIQFEIIKQKPQSRMEIIRERWKNSPYGAAREIAEENQHRLADGEKPLPWVPTGTQMPTGGRTGFSAIGMGKQQYAQWLNQEVYNKFNKGDIVTTRGMPFVPGLPPKTWFTVKEIQEIYYMADMDQAIKEPKALHCVSGKFDVSCWFAPSNLRQCTEKELEAIDRIRNPAPHAITSADRPDTGADTAGNQAATEPGRGVATPTEGESRPEEGNI